MNYKRIFITVIIFLSFTITCTGSVYYVATNGDDGNSGSKSAPWRSPAVACKRLKPGDSLIIRSGIYSLTDFESDILRPTGGNASAWITIKGENETSRPVLAGGDNLAVAIDLAGVDYLRLEHLEITSDYRVKGDGRWFRDGISNVGEASNHLIFNDLYIHHLDEFGIDLQDVSNIEISNCRVEFCGFGAIGGPEGDHGGWQDATIKHCRLSYNGHYYQGGDGSDRPYDRPDGFGCEPSQGPLTIVDTVAEHNYGDGLDSKIARTTILRCVVANNSCDGVKLWDTGSTVQDTLIYGTGDGEGGSSPWAGLVIGSRTKNAEFDIINVTIHDNPSRIAYILYAQYDDRDVPITVRMRNCIISNSFGVAYFGPSVTLEADHNLFYITRSSDQVEANGKTYTGNQLGQLGNDNRFGDPRFVRPSWGQAGDYQLKHSSPARDRINKEAASATDLDGTARPAGSMSDLGAFEWTKALKKLKRPGKAVCSNASGGVRIGWLDRSTNERGFLIERREKDGEWAPLAYINADSDNYIDTSVRSGTTYSYRISAITHGRSSKYSKIATITAK